MSSDILNNNNYGYVYCLTNKYMPDLCKIGYVNTENKTSLDRAKELSSNTSCPIIFQVVYDIKVKNPQKYEKRIHKKLKHFRINPRREFFLCKPEDIIKYFNRDNLIRSHDELEDFHENYLNKYNTNNTNIMKLEQSIEIKSNNLLQTCKKNFIYISLKESIIDIWNLFYIIFRLTISIFYYFYILVILLFKI